MFTLDYKKQSGRIVSWIKKTVTTAGFDRVVIGMSGGVDSSLAATLCVQALGKDYVFPVLLPYGVEQKEAISDALQVANWLEIPKEHILQFDIKPGVDIVASSVILNSTKGKERNFTLHPSRFTIENSDKIRTGNIMARVRMIYLFDSAKKLHALVCGTENKTEHLLGYFTRFGDSASDIEPIVSLYKTQVWGMAKELGVPEKIITKAPSAGLWENQTDEEELGFTYIQADTVLQCFFEKKLPVTQIRKKGIKKEIVEKILTHVRANAFKHKVPYAYK